MGIVCVCCPVIIEFPAVWQRKESSSLASELAFLFTGSWCIFNSVQQKNKFENRREKIFSDKKRISSIFTGRQNLYYILSLYKKTSENID